MNKIKLTNLIKLFVLIQLFEGPKHGYQIIKKISKNLDRKISPGEIYPFLKLLKKNGYVKIKTIDKRKKKIYHLTRKGKLFVKRTLNRFGDLIEISIKSRLNTCIHCGSKIYEGGYREIIKNKTLFFCCQNCARSYKKSI
jgi:DNA-binding PadR family transcriptional regulator